MKVSSRRVLGFALVLNGVIAAPLNPRNVEVVTVTEVTTEVVRYTSTLWVDPTPPASGPAYGPHGGDEDHDDDISTTSSVSIPETLATPYVSTSTSNSSVVPSSTLAYSSVETTQTTTSTPTTTPTTTPTPTPTPTTTPTTTPPTLPTTPLTTPTTTTTSTPAPPPPPAVKVATPEVPTTPVYAPSPTPVVPTTTPTPQPTTPASYGSSTGGGGGAFTGDATYYATGMGSCGIQTTDSDLTVAISHILMEAQNQANPNNNPLCRKKIICSYKGGPPVTIIVTDTCPTCDEHSLDLSPAAFAAVGIPQAVGRDKVQWYWAS